MPPVEVITACAKLSPFDKSETVLNIIEIPNSLKTIYVGKPVSKCFFVAESTALKIESLIALGLSIKKSKTTSKTLF